MTPRLAGAARTEARRKAVARYEAGASIRTVAEVIGRSYGTVRVLLLEAGVTLRSRGGKPRSNDTPES